MAARSFVIGSDSHGERVYVRARQREWGARYVYGLVRTVSEATRFTHFWAVEHRNHVASIIIREFRVIPIGEAT